jgi:hypothetical protein
MSFDRQAFEASVSQHSPLTPEQFDKMFGGKVTEETKAEAWKLMNLSAKSQFLVWQVIKAFPEATVEKIR